MLFLDSNILVSTWKKKEGTSHAKRSKEHPRQREQWLQKTQRPASDWCVKNEKKGVLIAWVMLSKRDSGREGWAWSLMVRSPRVLKALVWFLDFKHNGKPLENFKQGWHDSVCVL